MTLDRHLRYMFSSTLAVFFCLFCFSTAKAQTDYLAKDNVSHWASGKYAYISLRDGVQNGEESWFLTAHPDGSRTLQATNSYNDYTKTLRNVILRVDQRFRPLEAYATFWVDGAWRGSGWFTVNNNKLSAIVDGPNGRLTQSLEVPENFSFVPHPISTDSWPTWYYDKELGGKQPITLYTFDGRGFGVSGILGRLQSSEIEYLGEEDIETPAGVFRCEHYAFGEGDPQFFIFGQDRLLAKMIWKAAEVEYVLSEYKTGP